MRSRLHLVLLGPPGAGKTTVAEALVARQPLAVIATGSLLRQEMRAGSELGRAITPFMESGNLVPDGLMDRVLRHCIAHLPDEQGILLDGYPRTPTQALALDALLADHRRSLTAAILLDAADDEVVHRLSSRRICEVNGAQFPVNLNNPEQLARCQAQGGRLVARDDDTPPVIRRRLEVYHAQTEPLLAFYRSAGLLVTIDATRGATVIAGDILARMPANPTT